MYLSANLRYLRRKHDLSQTDLGEKVGVEYSAISRYERGSATPGLEIITKLAQAFSVSIEQLRNVDLTVPATSKAEEPNTAYPAEKVRQNPFAPPTKPAKHPMQVIVELDGTADCLERIYARLAVFNDAVADND